MNVKSRRNGGMSSPSEDRAFSVEMSGFLSSNIGVIRCGREAAILARAPLRLPYAFTEPLLFCITLIAKSRVSG